ncbi:MAG: hypothetical protein PHY08_09155 [Candidatus Cloacimonetes bacterium]|nr:hypothetical protein [Candidatus Cloacimonadota bacterium]
MWRIVKLGAFVKILNGYAFQSTKYLNSGIRIIRITNVQKGKVVDNDPQFYSSSFEDTLKPWFVSLENRKNSSKIGVFGIISAIKLIT